MWPHKMWFAGGLPYFAFHGYKVVLFISSSRQRSATFTPATCCLRHGNDLVFDELALSRGYFALKAAPDRPTRSVAELRESTPWPTG